MVLVEYLMDELSRLIYAYSRIRTHLTGEAVVQVTALLFDFVADHTADRRATHRAGRAAASQD